MLCANAWGNSLDSCYMCDFDAWGNCEKCMNENEQSQRVRSARPGVSIWNPRWNDAMDNNVYDDDKLILWNSLEISFIPFTRLSQWTLESEPGAVIKMK